MTEHLADRTRLAAPLDIARDDTVRLVLDENPTTGFRWAVASAEGAPVELVESDFTPGPTASPGAGGRRELVLRAPRAGTAQVRLELRRSWNNERADALLVTLRVT